MAARKLKGPSPIQLVSRIADLEAALIEARKRFIEFDEAIDSAQRMYHNCEEWTRDEREPIDRARNSFHEVVAGALGKEDG